MTRLAGALRWLAASWLALALLYPAATALASAPAADPRAVAVEVSRAELVSHSGVEAVQLPHVMRPGQFAPPGSVVTYRLALDLPQAPDAPLGIYLAKVSLAGQLRLNGHDLGSCAPGALEGLRCLFTPLYFTAGPSLWTAGRNTLEVRVWANERQPNGLSTVVVGPAPLVHQAFYEPARLWQIDLVQALQWSTLAFGVLSLMMWAGARGRRLYLWFGLACVFRALSNLNSLVLDTATAPALTHWLLLSLRLVSIPMTVMAVLSFYERRLPRLERAMVAYALLVPLLVAVSGNDTRIARALAAPMLPMAVVMVGLSFAWAWQSRRRTEMLLAPLSLTLLAGGMHDFALVHNAATFLRVPLLPYATGGMLLVLGGMIAHRVSQALQTKANLNRLLAERVEQHEAELHRKHQTILQLERAQARSQEREQLLRDLHDGLGSSLAAARMQVEEGSLDTRQLHQVLDDCIADMRLMLDTSAPGSGLADAVGNLRYRLDQRLFGSGIALVWRLGLEDEPPLGTRARLDLMRLLQEALTNALRHARASRIVTTVRYDAVARRLLLSVQDDGRGFQPPPPGAPGAGRGLANMRHRARQLGGELLIEGDGDGTRVELALSLAPAEDAVAAA